MPFPHSTSTRISVFAGVVFGLLFCSQFSLGDSAKSSLTASKPSIDFGALQLGKTGSYSEVLKNTGKNSVTLSSGTISGKGFWFTNPGFPLVLKAGQTVTVFVKFRPLTGTKYNGSLAVAWGKSRTLTLTLAGSGSGTGTTSVAPASLSFGSVPVGSSASKTAVLTASGASTTISSITTTNAEFKISGVTLPLTLAAGKSVGFTVKFTPQSSGTASANLSFLTSGSSALASQSLSGNGTAAAPAPTPANHTVNLSWQNATSAITGYNVYRSTVAGGPYTKVNAAAGKNPAYSDAKVSAGTNYFYVVTSLSTSGSESGYSGEVMAIVPTP